MAIGFARIEIVSRSRTSSTRKSAYNSRDDLLDERTGELFDFSDRAKPVHHAVLLPEGTPAHFSDAGLLWNAVEAAEHRKDAQVAREMVVALPSNPEVTHEDRVALVDSFAREHFVSKGLAVQIDIHAPEDSDLERDRANWHAHLLITTRRLGPEGISRLKARDLDPVVRWVGGRSCVVEGESWGELWRQHQDRYFREQGYDIRVEPNGLISEIHVGPRRMRRASSQSVVRLEALRQANREATYDPAQVLNALTRNNATFSENDLDRLLLKQLGKGKQANAEFAVVRAAVMASPDLVVLHDSDTGNPLGRFTTRQVREEERAALDTAGELDERKAGQVSAKSIESTKARWSLRRDQGEAFDYATGAGHLKLIAGRAGTGKSYTLSAIREAHERDGKEVIGLAPTNAVVQDMMTDGFDVAATMHSALFQLKNGLMQWGPNIVVMVDEAAMMGTPIIGGLLTVANHAGAKLILVGDDRQLPSIERGGIFPELLRRHASAEITEVTRQKIEWQRQAARDLAEYRFREAVAAFGRAGAISWSGTREEAQGALVEAWKRDHAAHPQESRFVFAYTNDDVDTLNAQLRAVCRERGVLLGPDVAFTVCYRAPQEGEEEELHRAYFSIGDRVQFTKTDKRQRIYNGNVGTITSLDPTTGQVTARLDASADGQGREVRWNANHFNGFRHGYAGTIYKGQGKTLDRTYLYHSRHWTSAPSYVALTRQRKSATIFVARETAKDEEQLAGQMARQEVRSASIAWPTQDELRERASGRPSQAGVVQPVVEREENDASDRQGVGEPKITPDLAPGRARFLKKYKVRQEDQRTTLAREQAAEVIQDWNRRIAAFRMTVRTMDQDAAGYGAARDRLLEFGQRLRGQPALVDGLHKAALVSDVVERATLLRVLEHSSPDQALAEVVAEAVQAKRERDQLSQNATGNQLRQRGRTEGR